MHNWDRASTIDGTDEVRLAVYTEGGDNLPALMVHGTGLCAMVFDRLAELLSLHWRMLAFDLRGHGASSRPSPPTYAWDEFARDARSVVEGLDLARPIGIGHSIGATALLLAEAANPGTFSWLYCFEPPTLARRFVDPTRSRQRQQQSTRRRSEFSSRGEAAAHFRGRGFFAGLSEHALERFVQYGLVDQPDGSVRLALSPKDEATIYRSVPTDQFSDLTTVTCPVTMAYGSASPATTANTVRQYCEHLPYAHLEEVRGVGHAAPFGAPEVVADSIIRSSKSSMS